MRLVINNKIKEDSAYGPNAETIIVISLVIMLIMILLALPNLLLNGPSLMSYDKLEYYTDELGLISEPEKLEEGMKVFHEKTGVKPYIYFVDNIMDEDSPDKSTVATWANEDAGEASLLIISLHNDEIEDYWILRKEEIKSIIDNEMEKEIYKNLTNVKFANTLDANKEELLGKAFLKSAEAFEIAQEKIDEVNSKAVKNVFKKIGNIIILAIFIISLFMMIGFFIKAREQKAIEEQKEYERAINIINTPMEKLIREQNVNKTTIISIEKDDHYIKSLFEKYKQPKENPWLKGGQICERNS